ncbi:MAG: transferrin-binding protein-like solute binding protein [Haemophilus haemolyticus]|jgi:transferrin-binding protein 2|uniref:Transferrin-binding protein B n=1 Tax=Haemophilus haemolyticus TaxID=726 RepID=A0AAQ1YK78_HAEHA|nr:transferrin-binding protein-like solute binding protein [Haemophilus haemolyticus]EGT77995.1 transferrin-binding protein 2 [Haemophilus haemolyticus M21127]MBS6021304.1 transferrin-binding protein-like solute binding protein [Haemophilus haemolyticus]MDU7462857.1 transferrin-binding protein-like solute binding protein [Haemophilus haemolyticus]TDN41309.1 Outer membrane receptor for lactoferrin or transferrin, lipoprotein B [Haemophilus haemolyticus]
MKSVSLITGGLSFLLSACSAGGGGSFDVDNVSNASSSKPHYQDDTSSSRIKSNLGLLSIPSLSGGMKLVAQNFIGDKEPSLLNENDYISYFSSLTMIKADVDKENKSQATPIGLINEPSTASQGSNSQKYVYSGLYYIDSWRDYSKMKEKKAYTGYYGYAFYYGNQTATNLPVNGVAKYKGTWNFITATENGKSYSLLSNSRQAYSRRSAISEDIYNLENNPNNGDTGLISEFSVDFGTKKLTGELYYNESKTNLNESQNRKHKLYDLKADVHSNRFRGNVTPTESTSKEHPFTSEGVLEGGFYGPNGEELGGKFLADNKRVFGVFSAKETPENSKLSKETLIDGKLTTFSTKTTDETNFITKDIPSFGEPDYLLIDNYPIPLLPENTGDFVTSKHQDIGNKSYKVEACCNNLNYVKFGMYYEDKPTKDKNNTDQTEQYHQFLLGHRTANAEIPKKGSAKYHGSWFGYISDGTTSYSTTGDKQRDKSGVSDFDVNFDNKTLKGELKRADTQNTVFNINATFNNGNAFTGTATAKDLVIDGKNSQTQNAKINITTDVNGAFYGPHASELGGYFTYNGKNTATTNSENSSIAAPSSNSENTRAAVVFGAKHQIETTK